MSQVRSDIITRVRDYLYEATADKFTDAQLQRFFLEELRALPSKAVYLEQIWSTTLVQNQQSYTLPANIFKVERVEINYGTASVPDWEKIDGWDNYSGALYLSFLPSSTYTLRAFLRMKFTDITDDVTTLEIDDDKSEILVWGIVIRAYKALIGYLKGDLSWDSVTKPGGISVSVVQAWLRDAKQEQKELIQQYATSPRPRDIGLVD